VIDGDGATVYENPEAAVDPPLVVITTANGPAPEVAGENEQVA